MKHGLIAAAGMAVALSGCVYSGGAEVVTALDQKLARDARIGEIAVEVVGTDAGLGQTLQSALRRELDRCATGSQTLDLQVRVASFADQNAAKTILIGDSATLNGTATLKDPQSGQTVGDYDVSESVGGGGILAAAAMSNADESLSREFAESLCSKAFGG